MAPGWVGPAPGLPRLRVPASRDSGQGIDRPDARERRNLAVQEDEVLVVMVSCPDAETATRLATALVKEGLAACVNQLPEVTSTYVWDGELQTETERLLLAKTTRSRLATLTRRVHDLHPWEPPMTLCALATASHFVQGEARRPPCTECT